MTYDLAGNLATETDARDTLLEYTYDAADRLVRVDYPGGFDTYGYDAAGRMTGMTDASGTSGWVYDEAGRTTSFSSPQGNEGYTYDDAGRRLTMTLPRSQTVTYDYDAAGRLETETDWQSAITEFTYDANGNRLAAGSDTFQYDWRNRLVEATVDSITTTYDYDGDDLRVARTVGSTTTSYRWDRAAGLPELVDAGDTDVVHGPAGPLAEVDTATVYPLRDGLGSLRTRTDDTGAVVGTADWDAWGNPRAASGTGGDLGWAGELGDPVTGQVYLRARDYSPGTGRFTSRDTVSPNGPGTQGDNPYAYAGNNPATLTDSSGHAPVNVEARGEVTLSSNQAAIGIVSFGVYAALEAYAPMLVVLAGEIIFMVAIVVIAILLVLAVVHLVRELAAWCRAHGCGAAVGSVRSWLDAKAGAGWSTVETGVAWAAGVASDAATNAACTGDSGPHGEVINPQGPEQCYEPCDEQVSTGTGSEVATLGSDVPALAAAQFAKKKRQRADCDDFAKKPDDCRPIDTAPYYGDLARQKAGERSPNESPEDYAARVSELAKERRTKAYRFKEAAQLGSTDHSCIRPNGTVYGLLGPDGWWWIGNVLT